MCVCVCVCVSFGPSIRSGITRAQAISQVITTPTDKNKFSCSKLIPEDVR